MENKKNIYFVGIKGVGMASLAIIAKQAGKIIEGSDIEEIFITDKILHTEMIIPRAGFKAENVEQFIEGKNTDETLVITTGAHGGLSNVEVEYARNKGIDILTHGQAVGRFMKGEIFGNKIIEGISICGSHGKTTISAMLATCLSLLGKDPSYTVGTSEIFPIGPAGHYGKGIYFVAEADEYVSDIIKDRTPKLLYQKPKYAIVNNIDYDHPDYYTSLDEVKNTFITFIEEMDKDSIVIINGDDDNLSGIKSIINTKDIVSFGENDNNDYQITVYRQDGLLSSFNVYNNSMKIGEFRLSIPGYHNAKNALSVIVLLIKLGFSVEEIQNVLHLFKGTKRRFEILGNNKNQPVIIDDYAHHPAEIKTTLSVIKGAFPDKRITCIFQPHTFSRTKSLLNDFLSAFSDIDTLILLPIFTSSREPLIKNIESEALFNEFKKRIPSLKLFNTKEDVIEYVDNNSKSSNNVIVTMGAGDVYKIAEKNSHMKKYVINGRQKLSGEVCLVGSKNIVLKAIVAACLTKEEVIITNVPLISDLYLMLEIVKALGGDYTIDDHKIIIKLETISSKRIPFELGAKIRTSSMYLCPLLLRVGEAQIPNPGGCRIGARPIERHLKGMEKMGVVIEYDREDGYFHAHVDKVKGTEYIFDKNTHTGTETLILMSVLAEGKTVLKNAAEEPEIDDLIRMLNSMGAKIKRIQPRVIEIDGVSELKGTEFRVPHDRNELVTFALVSSLTGGDIWIKDADFSSINAFLDAFSQAGGKWEVISNSARFFVEPEIKPIDIETRQHPGFMTDWQAPWAVFMTQASGVSKIHETVYENRFGYVDQLRKMGAKIEYFQPEVEDAEKYYNFNLEDSHANGGMHAINIFGKTPLHNAVVEITDLRAGATLVLASLIAKGVSVVYGIEHLERGYEDFDKKLKKLGADIELEEEEI
jgi:UDP-N-acetylglucosamine 1-carboxyvinyltransferase